jgi:transposase
MLAGFIFGQVAEMMTAVVCADCGSECRYESVDKVWRCRACGTPHEADGTAIRLDEEGRE